MENEAPRPQGGMPAAAPDAVELFLHRLKALRPGPLAGLDFSALQEEGLRAKALPGEANRVQLDNALSDFIRAALLRQNVPPVLYTGLGGALAALSERQGTVEMLEAFLPLLTSEEKQAVLLPEAAAFCRAQQTARFSYQESGEQKHLTAMPLTVSAAHRVCSKLVKQYNALPGRVRVEEQLSGACTSATEEERAAKKALREVKKAHRAACRAYLKERPDLAARKRGILLQGGILLLPGLVFLLVALLFIRSTAVRIIAAVIFALLAAFCVLLCRKRGRDLYQNAFSPAVLALGSRVAAAKERVAAAKSAKREAANERSAFRKTKM